MKEIIGYIGYPILKLSIFADKFGSGIGVGLLAVAIILFYICLSLDRLEVNKNNISILILSFLPLGLWFLFISLPVANAGVGNFILELCALFSLMILFSVIFKLYVLFISNKYCSFLRPYMWMCISVVIIRFFMPFIGK